MKTKTVAAIVPAAALALVQSSTAQMVEERLVGHILRPEKTDATDERVAALSLPEGFTISKWAEGLKNIRIFSIGPDGALYVTRRQQGDVLRLCDRNGDGRAEEPETVVKNLPGAHGIAFHGDHVYLCTVKHLYRARLNGDGSVGELEPLIDDLPDGGQHPNRTIAFAPESAGEPALFISVGSSCNACDEPNPEHATLLRAHPDGSSRVIFASGLRNTIGFDWHPRTGRLWGVDHGIDWLGDDLQMEELNLLEEGKFYGWPFLYNDNKPNVRLDLKEDQSWESLAGRATPDVIRYTAHAAPMQMVFYTGESFPEEYRGDAFVAMRGSWNRKPASGYELVRVAFDDEGRPEQFEPFVTGFLVENGAKHIGRLCGLAVAPDGALLLGDDSNGVIYRISYEPGDERPGPDAPTPPNGPRSLPADPPPAPRPPQPPRRP